MDPKADSKYTTVDDYFLSLPEIARTMMEQLRETIKQAAPQAEEMISYNMPSFKFQGVLVYYAAHKGHIGFYPGSAVTISIFKDDLVNYKTSKGTIQFPLGLPIPLDLVKKIAAYRVNENIERVRIRKEKRKANKV